MLPRRQTARKKATQRGVRRTRAEVMWPCALPQTKGADQTARHLKATPLSVRGCTCVRVACTCACHACIWAFQLVCATHMGAVAGAGAGAVVEGATSVDDRRLAHCPDERQPAERPPALCAVQQIVRDREQRRHADPARAQDHVLITRPVEVDRQAPERSLHQHRHLDARGRRRCVGRNDVCAVMLVCCRPCGEFVQRSCPATESTHM